jgi:hypothetical protein
MPRKSIVPPSSSERGQRNRSVLHLALAAIALVLLSSTSALAQGKKPEPHGKATSGAGVARGKYIVESVAICGQCHTPRDNDGNPDRGHWLQGAPVPGAPSKPDSNWPINAPRIGGTPLPASDSDMIKLLTTGIWTTGDRLRPPMPQFRLNRSDAEAVVSYLKSLNTQQ